jgi:predicted acylesterase/phospholipase RssA
MEKKILFVCSGGGARAIECHSGVIDAMKAHGIHATHGRGSSGGAVVLGFEMSGKSMFSEIVRTKMSNMISLNNIFWTLLGYPLYDNSGLKKFIMDKLGKNPIPNLTITMSDSVNQHTMYVDGNGPSVCHSTRMPEVFEIGKYSGPWKDIHGNEHVARNVKVVDGGVYDNIPVPDMKTARDYDHIFILVCNNDTKPKEEHAHTRLGRAMLWMNETMEREYFQVVNDWNWLNNVTIIRPSEYRSSILEFSDHFGLYMHTRSFAWRLLETQRIMKRGYFREEPK